MTVERTSGRWAKCTDCGETFHPTVAPAHEPCKQAPKPKEKTDVEKVHQDAVKAMPRSLKDTKKIPAKLKDLFEADLWDDEAMSCIRCGICTYLCPTCHCFDINDEITSHSPLEGKRVRTWDNCQFPDFTMHSSGHNPRPDKASRLRQRIMHKFNYFVHNFGEIACVGCGRCVSYCPVNIDIREIISDIVLDENQES